MIRYIALMILWASLVTPRPAIGETFTLRRLPQLDYSAIAPQGPEPALQLSPVDDGPEYKSTSKAVLYSLLIPGLGHRYLGENKTAAGFFFVDAAIWTSFIVFEVQADLRQDGYEMYAQQFAGVASTGHSDDYYALLTQYNSSADYESEVKNEGRAVYFPEGNAQQLEQYWIENRIGDFEPWFWASEEQRRAYQDQRSASKRSERRALYAVALAAANRVTAAIFAVKATRDINDALDAQTGFRIEFGDPALRASDIDAGLSIVRKF